MRLPSAFKQIVSSQLDVDRMDYLLRDSHYSGVSVGRADVHYLINCMILVPHGPTQCLALIEKGLKAYEGFVMARHLMNRSVYFHRTVRVFETMMERLIEQVVALIEDKRLASGVVAGVPTLLTKLVEGLSQGNLADAKAGSAFRQEHLEHYLDMTEDHVWNLVRRISASSGRSDLRRLADGLLQRRPVDNWPVQPGKGEFLKQALEDDFDSRDFDVIRAASTPYKVDGTPVYVHRANGQCDEASMLSELISSIHDKPESTSVLVVFNPSVSAKIRRTARSIRAID